MTYYDLNMLIDGEWIGAKDRETLAVLNPATGERTLPEVPAHRGAVVLLQDASWRVIGAADLPPVDGV